MDEDPGSSLFEKIFGFHLIKKSKFSDFVVIGLKCCLNQNDLFEIQLY